MIELSKNSIANYVVNRAIEACEKDQQQKFIDIITSSRAELVSFEQAEALHLAIVIVPSSYHASFASIPICSGQVSLREVRPSTY